MIFYLIFSILFFVAQAFIVLSTRINVFPELIFYPWLMSKGFFIYRDFAVQHGYFLQLILLPFVGDKSLFTIKSFFVGLQMVNLLIVLLVLKKTSNKGGFLLGGALFLSINYFLSDSNLWDEMILASTYLFIYYLLMQSGAQKRRMIIIGLLLGAASFMKPSFMVMIIPVIIFYRSFIPFIPLIALWLVSLLFFLAHNIASVFLFNYILYNKVYAFAPKAFGIDTIFLTRTLIFFGISLVISILYRKEFKKNPIVWFTLLSLGLFFPSFQKINLVPFGAFLSIFVGQLLGRTKKLSLIFYGMIVCSYLIFTAQQAKHLYKYFRTNRLPYLENPYTKRIVKKIQALHIADSELYVLGNNIEIYYFLDKLPPVWYTIIWKSAAPSYPDIEPRTIQEIKKERVNYIIIPQPTDINFSYFPALMKFVQTSYSSFYEDADVHIMKINN